MSNNLNISDSMYSKCKEGDIKLGTTIHNGKEKDVYFYNTEGDYHAGMAIFGKMGTGKSILLQNYINDSINSPNGTVVIDTSLKSNLTEIFSNLTENFKDDKIKIIDLSNPETVPALSFNDYSYIDESDINNRIHSIYRKSSRVVNFVDNQKNLSSKTKKYLFEMSMLVFSNNENATLNDIYEAIIKNDRKSLISSMPIEIFREIEDEFSLIDELEGENSDYCKVQKIIILERFQEFKCNFYLNSILNRKKSDTGLDIREVIDNKETLIIRIPSDIFNESQISTLINYYLNMILNIKSNNNSTKTDVFLEDICKYSNSYDLISELLVRSRILNTSLIFTSQTSNQLSNSLKENLLAIGSSFVLLSDDEIQRLKEFSFIEMPNLEGVVLNSRYTGLFVMINQQGKYDLFKAKLPQPFIWNIYEPSLI